MSGAIQILHEPKNDEPFIVLSKDGGLASAPLDFLDQDNAFSQCAGFFPQIKKVRGKKEVEGGLLHRIDTATTGLLLIAASQEFYDFIIECQMQNRFIKGYSALCSIDFDNAKKSQGFPKALSFSKETLAGFEMSSFFRPYGKGKKQVRPVLPDSNSAALKKIGKDKVYSTKIISCKEDGDKAFIECKIAQGFRHQVRCHLAWLGFPVKNDFLYNYDFSLRQKEACSEPLSFAASSLEFPDMNSDKIFSFSLPKNSFPF